MTVSKPSTTTSQEEEQSKLLSPKALAASLTPPRVPPFGSVHHAIYTNRPNIPNKWKTHYHLHDSLEEQKNQQQHSRHHHHQHHESSVHKLIRRMMHHWEHVPSHAHPHMAPTSPDAATRWLRKNVLGKESLNYLRDSGYFRSIIDASVSCGISRTAIVHPLLAWKHMELTRRRTTLVYGSHPRQFVDVLVPQHATPRRLVVFVHGGAWGSGCPWMYRLVAEPFLQRGFAVAIPCYRVYPSGDGNTQVQDIQQAIEKLSLNWKRITVMGHSSGAHVGLLLLARLAKEGKSLSNVDSFVGLSGPYDIHHHFHYEAQRGLEELSPMKAAMGHTPEGFRKHSPCLSLHDALSQVTEHHRAPDWFPPVFLVHGIEDHTVPFTASSEAARLLRAVGVANVEEQYLAETAHQDVVLQLVFGGRARDATVDWITKLDQAAAKTPTVATKLVARSKL